MKAPITIAALRLGVLLNRSSGSVDAATEVDVGAILAEAGIRPEAVVAIPGREVDTAIAELTAKKLEALVVLGGDGTIRSAAEECSRTATLLIPLPGGTMNLLPHALYGEHGWRDILREIIKAPAVVEVGAGEVENHRFFCAGIFGTPSHWAEAREALRESRISEAVRRAIRAWRRSFSGRLHYSFNLGDIREATAMAVICPLISKVMPPDAPAFEAAALCTPDLGEAFFLALSGMFTDWRLAAQATSVATRTVSIASKRRIPALLDGERVTLSRKAEIRFVPAAFKALVPHNSPMLTDGHEEVI